MPIAPCKQGPALARILAARDSELRWLRERAVLSALNFAMISLNLTLMAAATFSACARGAR
jgi:hypothetical protein